MKTKAEVCQRISAVMASQEPILTSAHSSCFEAGIRIYRTVGERDCWVCETPGNGRGDRVAWRDDKKIQAEEKRRASEIQVAQITAKENGRADEFQMQMAKIEAEMNSPLNSWNCRPRLKSILMLLGNPPPPYRDAKSLKLPAFMDEKDELDNFLVYFECYAKNAQCKKDT